MESNVDKLTTLLDKSEVNAVLLDLLLLLFDYIISPNCLILDINIVGKHVVEVIFVLMIVIQGEFVLCISKCFLLIRQLFFNIFEVNLNILISVKRFRMVDPIDLPLNDWIEASPLLTVFFGWELPEDLL